MNVLEQQILFYQMGFNICLVILAAASAAAAFLFVRFRRSLLAGALSQKSISRPGLSRTVISQKAFGNNSVLMDEFSEEYASAYRPSGRSSGHPAGQHSTGQQTIRQQFGKEQPEPDGFRVTERVISVHTQTFI